MKTSYALAACVALLYACTGGNQTHEETPSGPIIQSKEVTYNADGIEFHGWMAWDSTIHEKRPGVIVVHEWWGHNDYARKRARMLAEMGYTAFAIDMFGNGKNASHPDSAMAFVRQALATAEGARNRFVKAEEILKSEPTVNPENIAAIGYCFGGTVVLEMARAGVDLDGVVSFHGGLDTEHPADSGMVKTKVLACTGADDPFVPAEQVDGFKNEMEAGAVDYQLISYPGAVHAFTNPAADSLGKLFNLPLAYNPQADTASWSQAGRFLHDVFAH